MSIKIDLSSRTSSPATPVIHHIPCKIEHDGNANVSKYFTTGVRNDKAKEGDLTGTFRGRPLNGCKIAIPEGYTGIILKEAHKPFADDEEREFRIKHEFKEYTSWNLDLPCSGNDKIHQAFEWISIASSVHAPVQEKLSPKSDSSR